MRPRTSTLPHGITDQMKPRGCCACICIMCAQYHSFFYSERSFVALWAIPLITFPPLLPICGSVAQRHNSTLALLMEFILENQTRLIAKQLWTSLTMTLFFFCPRTKQNLLNLSFCVHPCLFHFILILNSKSFSSSSFFTPSVSLPVQI